MRVFTFVTPALLLFAGAASAQYVGVTESTFDGAQGVFTYNLACHAAHPGSRMCTTKEVMNTVNPPIVGSPGETAWVHPIFQPGGDVNLFILDASGRTADSCKGWSNINQSGMTIHLDNGAFESESCGTVRSVACCIPVPEPSGSLSIPSGAGMLLVLAKLRGVGLGR